MIKSSFNNIKVKALVTAVPSKWTPVEEFINEPDEKNIAKFKKSTGVEGRYDASNKQTTADLCYAAAMSAVKHDGVDPADIGLLVFVTQTPDYIEPATACVLQNRLGMSDDCMAFDVNLGCSGLMYGINIVSGIMESSNVKYALLMAGDTTGKNQRRYIEKGWVDREDNEAKLFGDAGCAMLFEKTGVAPPLDMAMRTDGSGFKAVIKPWGGERHFEGPQMSYMNGIDVFNFAIEKPPALIKELMRDIGTKPEDYDCIILHQANKLIMKNVARRAGFSSKQNLLSIDKFGNTSSASIATALTKHYGDDNDGSVKAMLCGFGIGLSWGAVSIELEKSDILPLLMTDEYFDDGYEDHIEHA